MDSFDKAFAQFPNNFPVRQDRISDISELMSPTIQRVRGEFLDDTFLPKIHIAHKSMALSPSCIGSFQIAGILLFISTRKMFALSSYRRQWKIKTT